MNNFKQLHGLTRPAYGYESRGYKIGVLILILAIESVLNGFFLSKGSDFGLVGGFFQALIIACVNVFGGAVTGRQVTPWIIHRNFLARAFSTFGLLIYVLADIGFNLAVAHYRNAVAKDPFEASAMAYQSFMANPTGIDDLQSWLLVLVGIIFSGIALADGLLMDDPYPGYGKRIRHNLEALEDYTTLKDQLLEDLEEIKTEAEKELDEILRDIATRQGEFDYILRKSQALRISMLQHFTHLELAGNTLLAFYRDENRKHRRTAAPSRFNAKWSYKPPVLGGEDVTPSTRTVFDELVRKVLEEAPMRREELHNSYRNELDKYKRIDELVKIETET